MRTLSLLNWLLRVQVVLGLVKFFGPYAGFAWPPTVWMAHRVIAVVAPTVAFVAFRRGAWGPFGQPASRRRPRVRVAARLALLAPLALGLCFSAGVLHGRAWGAVHIGVAVAALMVIERAAADFHRARADAAGRAAWPDRRSVVEASGA